MRCSFVSNRVCVCHPGEWLRTFDRADQAVPELARRAAVVIWAAEYGPRKIPVACWGFDQRPRYGANGRNTGCRCLRPPNHQASGRGSSHRLPPRRNHLRPRRPSHGSAAGVQVLEAARMSEFEVGSSSIGFDRSGDHRAYETMLVHRGNGSTARNASYAPLGLMP